MTRITNAIKEAIVDNALLKAGIVYDEAKLLDDRYTWSEAVRIDSMGGQAEWEKIRDTLRKISKMRKSLPDGLDQGHSIIKKRNQQSLNLAGAKVVTVLSSSCPAVWSHTLIASNPLVQQFHDLEGRQKDINERRHLIKAQVSATVAQFTTIKRLLESWPDAAELLPAATVKAEARLPVVQVADLNKMIGLPSGEEA